MGIKNSDGTFTDRCLDRLRPGEPFFVLRAQDLSTPRVITEWLRTNPQIEGDRMSSVLDEMSEIRRWQSDNPGLVKRAD